jgi:DNA polymerase V
MIFHVDGNSFYAACERVFRPDLKNSPIAVLSNNDGIIIALNAECKELGFRRGDVFYQVKDRLEKCGVAVFSSNYTLYADMSARLNLIYGRFAPEIETYSIDESFLFFPKWNNVDYAEIGFDIRNTVLKETGIPVSVGIAPSKTLAKMCNKLAKQRGGVCDWNKLNHDEELGKYPVGDIWGIGEAKAALLKRKGISTALALKRYPLDKAKKYLTITGVKTIQDLNGITAVDKIEEAPRQVVMVSRSFRSAVFELGDIIAALAEYTQEAVSRMRADKLACRFVSVYLMTNAYAEGEPYFNQMTAELPYLSAYLPEIQTVADELLKNIFRAGYKYRKVMIGLTGLEHDNNEQLDLFNEGYNRGKALEPLMQAFEEINNRYGRGTVKLACGIRAKSNEKAGRNLTTEYCCPTDSLELHGGGKRKAGDSEPWGLKMDYLSPAYTTNIEEIPLVF